MPEAFLTAGRRGRKTWKPKQLASRRQRQVGAAVKKLTPDLDAVEEEEEGCEEDAEIVLGDFTTWACPRCTFANASVMPLCEICELPRSAIRDYAPVEETPRSCLQASLSSQGDAAESSWDSTWTQCEVSSMGSWLDVGDAQSESSEHVPADFGFVFEEGVGAESDHETVEASLSASPRTWASRLTSSAGRSAAPLRPQRPKVMVPPLVRRRPFPEGGGPFDAERRSSCSSREFPAEEEEEDEEEALFSQWPRFQRGATQRRRMLGRSSRRGS
jgi:hypothetical protein